MKIRPQNSIMRPLQLAKRWSWPYLFQPCQNPGPVSRQTLIQGYSCSLTSFSNPSDPLIQGRPSFKARPLLKYLWQAYKQIRILQLTFLQYFRSQSGRLWLAFEGKVLDRLRLLSSHRVKSETIQVLTFQGKHTSIVGFLHWNRKRQYRSLKQSEEDFKHQFSVQQGGLFMTSVCSSTETFDSTFNQHFVDLELVSAQYRTVTEHFYQIHIFTQFSEVCEHFVKEGMLLINVCVEAAAGRESFQDVTNHGYPLIRVILCQLQYFF